MELSGRVAIVTGGASGAGWSIVLRLADEGVAVVVADVSDFAGEAAVAAIVERGGAGSFVRTDVRVDGDVEHMVSFAEERHGGVDILVNNAGGWGPTANYPRASGVIAASSPWARSVAIQSGTTQLTRTPVSSRA